MQTTTTLRLLGIAVLIAALGALPACDDEETTPAADSGQVDASVQPDAASGADATPTDAAEENTNEEGCEHTKQGPFEPATGATPAGIDAAGAIEVKADHKAYRVALAADTAGWIKFLADEAGELLLFVSEDVPLLAKDAAGDPVDIEERADVSECTEVAKRHTIDIAGAGAFFFVLGGQGTAATTVTIVVEESGHHHHHDGGA
jgi:hypothetical protein